MIADLTCGACGGSGLGDKADPRFRQPICGTCSGRGRRPPELHEWDALKVELIDTEADAQAWCNEAARYRRALTRIYTTVRSRSARKIARAALDKRSRNMNQYEVEKEHDLTDEEFRVLLNLFMANDPPPWDESDDALLEGLLNRQAAVRGYDRWVDAYHEFQP